MGNGKMPLRNVQSRTSSQEVDEINIEIATIQKDTCDKYYHGAFGFQRGEVPSGWATETLQS